MRVSKLVSVAVLVGSGMLMAACGPSASLNTGSGASAGASAAGNQKQQSVMELLRTDTKGSMQKVSEAVAKQNSMAFNSVATINGKKTTVTGKLQSGNPLKISMSINDPDTQNVTAMMIGTVVYVQVPEAQRSMLGGKQWIKIDLAQAGTGVDGYTGELDDLDPARVVSRLLASGAFSVVGDEAVGGANCVHYRATQSVTDYLKNLPAGASAARSKALQAASVKEVTTDLWVDESYQLRRTKTVTGDIDSTTDFSDFGTAVNVTPPADAEVMDMAGMASQLGG